MRFIVKEMKALPLQTDQVHHPWYILWNNVVYQLLCSAIQGHLIWFNFAPQKYAIHFSHPGKWISFPWELGFCRSCLPFLGCPRVMYASSHQTGMEEEFHGVTIMDDFYFNAENIEVNAFAILQSFWVLFTEKKLAWIINEVGSPQTQKYFRILAMYKNKKQNLKSSPALLHNALLEWVEKNGHSGHWAWQCLYPLSYNSGLTYSLICGFHCCHHSLITIMQQWLRAVALHWML